MWDNVTVFEDPTSGTPLYTPSNWYTFGKFWYTLGCTIHPEDKHCMRGNLYSNIHEQGAYCSFESGISCSV